MKKTIIVLVTALVLFILGVGLIVFGAVNADGDSFSDTGVKGTTADPENIECIEIDALASSIEIIPSTDGMIHVSYYNSFFCKYEDSIRKGVLKIEATDVIPHISFGTVTSSKVVISVPDGLDIDIDAELDVGEFLIRELTVNGKLKVESDVGEINIRECRMNKLDASSDVGTINFDRVDCKDIECESDVSAIKGTLVGKEEDYSIECKTEFGACNLSDRSGGERKLKVRTDVGTIEIKFEP